MEDFPMANTLDVHRYIEFTDAVKDALQQNESKLMRIVMEVTNSGKMQMHDFLEEIGNFDTIDGRHANTKLTEPEHNRRMITCRPRAKTFLIDDEDQARQAHNIGSKYVSSGAKSYNRSVDEIIYTALDAVAMAGENGDTPVARPTTNDIAVDGAYTAANVWDNATGTASGLTIDKLRQAKVKLDLEYAHELGEYFFIASPLNLDNLLGTIEATSADYNTVKTLTEGKIGSFMGFTFIPYNSVDVDGSNVYDCYAVAKDAMYLAKQKGTGALNTKTSIRADKNNATQIQMKFDQGSTRMYDEAVIKVKCQGY
jgi:hypothetical protein